VPGPKAGRRARPLAILTARSMADTARPVGDRPSGRLRSSSTSGQARLNQATNCGMDLRSAGGRSSVIAALIATAIT